MTMQGNREMTAAVDLLEKNTTKDKTVCFSAFRVLLLEHSSFILPGCRVPEGNTHFLMSYLLVLLQFSRFTTRWPHFLFLRSKKWGKGAAHSRKQVLKWSLDL